MQRPLAYAGRLPKTKSEVCQLSSLQGQIHQRTSFTHKIANIMAVEKQKLEFPKSIVQAGRLHFCQATPRNWSEILRVGDLALNPYDPVCTRTIHTHQKGIPAVDSRGEVWSPQWQDRGRGHFSGPEREASASLDLVGFGSWEGFPVSAFPGQVALESPTSRASEQAGSGRGLSGGSCRLEAGREAPLVTAPHETLMPGRRTAISRHLEPKWQPRSPVAVDG